MRELQPCGTPAAAERHRRRGEPLDDACRLARNARALQQYHSQRTMSDRLVERMRKRARAMAYQELRRRHALEWQALYRAALDAEIRKRRTPERG